MYSVRFRPFATTRSALGLTERSFRLKFANKHVQISKLPSKRLQKFGSSMQAVAIRCEVTDDFLVDICERCPNLKSFALRSVWATSFYNPIFRKTLSRLKELEIGEIRSISSKGLQAAMQCCENLTSLMLAMEQPNRVNSWESHFEPVLKVKFPKLRRFQINLKDFLTSDIFTYFLQINSTIKSLQLQNKRDEMDLSCILKLQTLEKLILLAYDSSCLHSIIPNLFQLKKLRTLEISSAYRRDVFKTFFASFNRFQHLSSVLINLGRDDDRGVVYDIDDQDLMHLKYFPNLTDFTMTNRGNRTFVTLPGIVKAVKHCPKLTFFYICGFRQNLSPDGITFMDEDIYESFFQILKQDNVKRVIQNHGYFRWYGICLPINIYKTVMICSEWTEFALTNGFALLLK